MPKGTMLDRLAGAMKTLSKREGKTLTPRQRVAAAQRWNSLADIGEDEIATLEALADEAGNRGAAQRRYVKADDALEFMNITDGNGFRADNPFLSDNIDKYAEQSDFLDWCRYNRLEPNGRNLKQYRWETYKTLPYRQQVWAKYKDDIIPLNMAADWVGATDEVRNARTLKETDDAYRRYDADTYPEGYPLIDEMTPYRTIDEFPDYLKPGWQY